MNMRQWMNIVEDRPPCQDRIALTEVLDERRVVRISTIGQLRAFMAQTQYGEGRGIVVGASVYVADAWHLSHWDMMEILTGEATNAEASFYIWSRGKENEEYSETEPEWAYPNFIADGIGITLKDDFADISHIPAVKRLFSSFTERGHL
jgi:hypothetical protein